MSDGGRFRKRLPRYLGKISDFNDLLQAEDKEFNYIDDGVKGFVNALFIGTIEKMDDPEKHLINLEKEYGLNHEGTVEERVNKILAKKRAKEPTTPYRVEELGNHYSDVEDIVKFFPRYEEYSFSIEFLLSRGKTDIQGFLYALEEIKPAHLAIMLSLLIEIDSALETRSGDYTYPIYLCGERTTGLIPRIYYEGQATYMDINLDTAIDDANNYYPLPGQDHTQPMLHNDKEIETINISDLSHNKVYSFEGGE